MEALFSQSGLECQRADLRQRDQVVLTKNVPHLRQLPKWQKVVPFEKLPKGLLNFVVVFHKNNHQGI